MNEEEIILIAKQFLNENMTDYLEDVKIGRKKEGNIEVVFKDPQINDPCVATIDDGEEFHVWINEATGKGSFGRWGD